MESNDYQAKVLDRMQKHRDAETQLQVFLPVSPRLRTFLNAVIVVSDELAVALQLEPLPDTERWVMFLCKTVLVASEEEAMAIVEMLVYEDAHNAGRFRGDHNAVQRVLQELEAEKVARKAEIKNDLADAQWPLQMRAPQMPFKTATHRLTPLSEYGLAVGDDQVVNLLAEHNH